MRVILVRCGEMGLRREGLGKKKSAGLDDERRLRE